jgi:hypothetical protein
VNERVFSAKDDTNSNVISTAAWSQIKWDVHRKICFSYSPTLRPFIVKGSASEGIVQLTITYIRITLDAYFKMQIPGLWSRFLESKYVEAAQRNLFFIIYLILICMHNKVSETTYYLNKGFS